MSPKRKLAVLATLGLLVAGVAVWAWFDTFERRWIGRAEQSSEATRNPMLAATRWLSLQKTIVRNQASLGEALRAPLPKGTLILASNGGVVSTAQWIRLLDWVRNGNTLIAQARLHEGDAGGTDPIAAYEGVTRYPLAVAPAVPGGKIDPDAPLNLMDLFLPGAEYRLQIEVMPDRLKAGAVESGRRKEAPGATGPAVQFLRVFSEGRGHIVLTSGNYFDNRHLGHADHAELLLALTGLAGRAPVLIVQRPDVLRWHAALWDAYAAGLVSLACALALLGWSAARRFGPLLPEPDGERRALIEHIDASGRWLWKLPGGRETLLAAARALTGEVLARRVPQLGALTVPAQLGVLEQASGLARAQLAAALHERAARAPIDFTRQIQTLQQLRKHYERLS